jgi:hypothetical protein
MYTPRIEDSSRYSETLRSRISTRSMSIDNLSSHQTDETRMNKENKNQTNGNGSMSTENISKFHQQDEQQEPKQQTDDEDEQIIPWRMHLRKTNSRLSLVG